MHPNNPHNADYDFDALTKSSPTLAPFVLTSKRGSPCIDFSKPEAVLALNKALLIHFYGVHSWDLPRGNLCPPIPGRADYIHYLAELLSEDFDNKIPKGRAIKGLDIGVGANCIYPIIGHTTHGWRFIGADCNSAAVNSAKAIIKGNQVLKHGIKIRFQKNSHHIFSGIVRPDDRFDFTLCNPPFHASMAEAESGSRRKIRNLTGVRTDKPSLNFGGKQGELWFPGGEVAFCRLMIEESVAVSTVCVWFTTLLSKNDSVAPLRRALDVVNPREVRVINMHHGNKVTRIVAWSFMSQQQRRAWRAATH